jgi:outer membrane protein OmpA-like peptidoglycan-associated protein
VKNNNFFWVSYSDLMTSLFFVMMVLFVITVAFLHKQKEVTEEVLEEIKSVQKALSELDSTYYEFDEINKRYKLNIDVKFPPNSADINGIAYNSRKQLIEAGQVLYEKVSKLIYERDDIDYLIVIEGSTQRLNENYLYNPDGGYKLSYQRSLALVNLWKSNGIDFTSLGDQCEIIIAGSGYFGKSRDKDENKNRRFTIQITSKIGKLIEE